MWPITCLAQSLFSFSRGTLKINNYVVNPSPLSLEMWQASEWTNHIQILHTAHTCFNLKPTDWPWIKFNCFCWLFLKFLHDESHLTVQAMARHRITASEGSHSLKCISQEKGTKSFGKHSIQSRHAIRTGRGTRDDVTHHFDTYKISLAALALVKKSAGDFLQYICRGDRSPFTDQLWGTLTVLPPLLPSAEKFHDPICFSRFTTQRWN